MEKYIDAYDGDDMAGYIMAQGFELPKHLSTGRILSITNTRNASAVIVTEYQIYRARPQHGIGFCIEVLFNNL